ncbi:MAG: lipid II:glycine glycyltransferase FemX, partial [Candidatus Limnocylindrales bacterium]
VIDRAPPEDVLWSDLRGKWRQYVNRARNGRIRVEERGREDLPAFHAIMAETSARTGTPIRTEASYRAVWDAFAPGGRARLLFALSADDVPVAVLFLIRAGSRVVEPYGGMTRAGADTRANYLLKWEAIRSSREAGASSYDMWGLVHPGIRQFKEGFGGREVRLVGAFDLDLRPLGARLYRLAERRRGPRRTPVATGSPG